MANQDLIFPFLPKPGPLITPGVEILHVNKLSKSKRLKAKKKSSPDNNKYHNIQKHLKKRPEPKAPNDEHEIDLFV